MKPEVVKRLAPTKRTLSILFSLSGNRCAFPECDHKIFNSKNKLISQVCHIEAASTDGQRFNPNSSNQKRRQLENLIVLCYEHHQETNDIDQYPPEKMREIKSNHEVIFRGKFNPTQNQIENAFEMESKLAWKKIEHNTENLLIGQVNQTEILYSMDSKIHELLLQKQITKGFSEKVKEFSTYISNHQIQVHCGAMLYEKNITAVFWNDRVDKEYTQVLPNFRRFLKKKNIEELSFFQKGKKNPWVMLIQTSKAREIHEMLWALHPAEEHWKNITSDEAHGRLWTH